MAKTLSLAMKIFADAGGVVEKLSPVQKALQQLDAETAKVTDVFKRFGTESATAAATQEKFETRLQALNDSLRAGLTNPQDYARALKQLQAAANEAAGDLDKAARVIEANLTREQRAQRDYATQTEELNRLRSQGLLTEEQYATALQRVSGDYAKATLAADKFGEASGKAGDGGALKFNELSGVLSVLPGPIGNVAGRLSGLASAGEGLSRVFSGGLSAGISSVGASVAGLINPFTAAVAGVAAFGAGAVAVTQGLIALDDRVERLGNTADKLGVSFEFIQTIEEAAERSGTSIDAVSAAFGRLQKSVLGVDEESKAAQKALSEIGVTAEELQALSPQEQYRLIGKSLAAIEDPARRTATATALFGKAGAELIPFFNNLPGAAADIERFGRALTEIDRGRIDDFGAGLDTLRLATQGLGQSLLLPFAGLGEGVARASADFIAAVTAVVDVIGRALTPALDQIGFLIDATGTVLGSLAPLFRALGDAIEPVAQFLLPAVVAQMIALNAQAVAGAISSLAGFFTAAATALIGYATSAGTASISTAALAASVRGLLASTGVGALVVGLGLAANALIEWFSTADDAAKNLDASSSAAKAAGDSAAAAAEKQKELAAAEKKAREERDRTFQRLREEVNNAIDDSRKFGAEGQAAAQKYDQSVEALKKRLSSGLIDDEQFRRSVRIAGQVFDEELKAIEDRKQIEIKVTEDAAKAIEKVGESIDKAAIKAEDLGAAGTNALGQFSQRANELRSQFAAGIIDDKQLEKGVEAANRQYEKQLEAIKAVNAERQKQIEEDRKRSEALLDEADRTRSVQRDREAVEREMARLRAEAARQRFFTPEQRQQLLELAGLQEDLAEKQRAVAQGFEKGYAEAFDKTKAKFQELAEKSREFGAEGERAAKQLAAGLFQAQQAAAAGTISRESYEAEVARQQRLYDEELKRLKAVADERLKTNQMVDEILLLQSVGGDSQRAEAKKKLLSIEEEMLRVQQDIAAARKADDTDAIRSGTARLAQLDQAAAVERDIASGQAKIQQDAAKRVEEQQKQAQQVQQAYAQEQARIFEEQRKAAEAESQRQEKRLRDLNTLGQQSINVQDVRTTEGANLVIQTATRGQDPAAIQARLQTKYLEQIAAGILQASRNYFNAPVSIVGAGSFGDVRA